MSDPVLERGKVLVIVGEQGSGKTTLALRLANDTYGIIGIGCLVRDIKKIAAYDAIIIDEGYPSLEVLEYIKTIITNTGNHIPYVIICCLPEQLPPCANDSRRFVIHKMEKNSHV